MRKFSALALAGALAVGVMSAPAEAATKGSFGKKAGYNGIRIGMTLKQAKAAGKLKFKAAPSGSTCFYATYKKYPSATVTVSKKYGVVLISAHKKARTPRGIGIGATLKQIKKAYPDFHAGLHYYEAKVPGYSPKKVRFNFGVGTDQRRIDELHLVAVKQDCFN